jgi:hypothetical protein
MVRHLQFDQQIASAADVERFVERAAPFIVFHYVPKQDE